MAKAQSTEQHPAISFLRTLYALTPGSWVELRAIANDKIAGPKPRRVFVKTPEEIKSFIASYGDRKSAYGVYFGICKRETQDGTKKSIARVPALWVDLDTVKNGWDTDEMVKRIHAIPGVLRPSACVKSGGGLHLYWFLDDPYDLISPSDHHLDAGEIESTNKMLRDVFAGDAVQNLDRIFRLPGTWNTKRKASQVEVAWNYGFDLKNYFELQDAALHTKKWIGIDGNWGNKGAVLKSTRPVAVDPMAKFEGIYGEGTRTASKNLNTMWSDRVRYHAPRGYIGIHEASLIHTAQLYMTATDMPESKIVEIVMSRIAASKDRDAPDESWDMEAEAKIVRDMLRSWQPKWKEYVADRRRERAAERKKNNGRSDGVRNSRGRSAANAG